MKNERQTNCKDLRESGRKFLDASKDVEYGLSETGKSKVLGSFAD